MEWRQFRNPYRPGAGHMPPYLAGREEEVAEFRRLLQQDVILENLVLTGLRGVGKTVLLEKFKPLAIDDGWTWVGTDLSETASLTEANLASRLLTDLSVITSSFAVPGRQQVGFHASPEASQERVLLDYSTLMKIHSNTPGLDSDKLKGVLEFVAKVLLQHHSDQVIFAYDEAQNLSDHAARNSFPLSVLLDVFQSIQRKGIRFMLVLTGLPTLLPKLIEARTYSERMFRVIALDRLNDQDSEEAIIKPISVAGCPVTFGEQSIEIIVQLAGGYPYFIQFICREVFDVFTQQLNIHQGISGVPVESIQRKLDTDFFSGRWARATDRQQQLLWVIANLENADSEFTISELVQCTKVLLPRGFSPSHVSQMLSTLADRGLIYKHRFGKYSFAVPLMAEFILRNYDGPTRSSAAYR